MNNFQLLINNLLSTILKDTYTVTQLKHRLNILKTQLLQNFFGAPQKQLAQTDLAWLRSLPVPFLQNFNKDNTYDIFSQLEDRVTRLKTLIIYLTFEPDDGSLTSIGIYARKAFGNSLLLDIKYDPNLIAGAALVWKGVYKDYSLRAGVEEKKGEILQSFKKFLR